MMVADDEIYALTLGILDFLDSLNTAVEHNHQSYTSFFRMVYSFSADTIALLITVGDIILNVGIELL